MRFNSLLMALPAVALTTGIASADTASYKVGELDPFANTTYALDTTNDGGIVLGSDMRMWSMGDNWNQVSVGSTSTHDWTPQIVSEGGNDHTVIEGVRVPIMRFDVSSMAGNYDAITGGTLEITLYDRQAGAPSFMFDVKTLTSANAGWTFGTTADQAWANYGASGAYKGYQGNDVWDNWAANSNAYFGFQPGNFDQTLNISKTLVDGVETQLNKRVIDGEGNETWVATNNMYSAADTNSADGKHAMTYVIDLSAELIEEWIADPTNAGFAIVASEVIRDAEGNLPTTNPLPAAIGSLNDNIAAYRPVLNIDYTTVPEPASLALFGIGALAMLRRKH
ncbi:hypothetical protein KS4_07140 [Poriferisphaera corsica]|uniref:Ice-binding protein C-terminal domain-containing protein n=1 Tax=Poriferisphaera corsica TaxID=2528020 RepID=A0A517YR27_9BACT|nr:PEP-CTERM sorting domain-containing protein [Poriferisphaera corsica]QDU32680.1 hypothetical protein KS4_07140 [Poriferisphaera corsica]